MMGTTHLTTGLFISGVLSGFNPADMMVGSIASLLPDIDEPKSTISKKIPLIPYIIRAIFGHRTITHSLPGFLLFTVPVLFFWRDHLMIFITGYLSHLVLDSFTKSGIPLCYPFVKTNFGLKLIKTGGLFEMIFLISLICSLISIYQKAVW